MKALLCILIIAAVALAICLVAAFVCFLMVFYSPKRNLPGEGEYEIPKGEIYEIFRDDMIAWTKQIREMKHTDIEIRSRDGLTLRGSYYEYQPNAPIEILFHGYRGYAERDLNGGVERCFALGRSALLVDHRAHGRSDGHVITFGIKECRDCIEWVREVNRRFGEDTPVILTGVSMGAATVMMAAGEADLPENVICVLADCGYSSAREIIRKTIREMKLPAWLVYPFIKLGARLFGGFSLESNSPMDAMKRARIPVIFVHGDCDDFVPHEMSEALYKACSSEKKRLVTVEGAGHGLAFPVGRDRYIAELSAFAADLNEAPK